MTQQTMFGEAELTTYMQVKRLSGAVEYYRVREGRTEAIDKDTYDREAVGEK